MPALVSRPAPEANSAPLLSRGSIVGVGVTEVPLSSNRYICRARSDASGTKLPIWNVCSDFHCQTWIATLLGKNRQLMSKQKDNGGRYADTLGFIDHQQDVITW